VRHVARALLGEALVVRIDLRIISVRATLAHTPTDDSRIFLLRAPYPRERARGRRFDPGCSRSLLRIRSLRCVLFLTLNATVRSESRRSCDNQLQQCPTPLGEISAEIELTKLTVWPAVSCFPCQTYQSRRLLLIASKFLKEILKKHTQRNEPHDRILVI
jgi:hypothetical protein